MTTNRPHVQDSYATALAAVRLMEAGSREQFQEGSDLLTGMGEEATAVLALIARELLTAVAVLTDRDRADVLDHMALRNIELAEGMADDEQG